MADPNRRVRRGDHVIFLSHTSNPQAEEMPYVLDYSPAGKRLLNDPLARSQRVRPEERATALHLLLCGWRSEWSRDVSRFRDRLADVAEHLPKGSTVTCVNVMSGEAFQELLEQLEEEDDENNDNDDGGGGLGFEGSAETGWVCRAFGHALVKHFCADAVIYDQVKPLFEASTHPFHTAICLGTVVGRELPSHVSDARILSMLLILRKLTFKQAEPLHIIAENKEDQTSQIGLAPRVGVRGFEPDFINTQAIIA